MSGYEYQSDSNEYDGDNGGGGGLRRQYEDALKELRELRAELRADKRQETVTDLLSGAGLDPAVAQFIPQDADAEAWVKDNAKFFAPTKAEETLTEATDVVDTVSAVVAPTDDPAIDAERQALAAMRNAQESGSQSTTTLDPLELVHKASTEEELMALVTQAQRLAGD